MRPVAGRRAGLWLCLAANSALQAQQFNSDSWISKEHGTATVIVTAGQRTTMMMTTLSLLPRWEFTVAAYIYNRDADRLTSEGHSTSAYASSCSRRTTRRPAAERSRPASA